MQSQPRPHHAAVPHQAALFALSTEDLAAFLRAEYARLEPFRPLLARVCDQCCAELRRVHRIPAARSDVLASAEDFLLALLNGSPDASLDRPHPDANDSALAHTMHAHVMAHFLEAPSRRGAHTPEERRHEEAAAAALMAVESVLVRATAVAAEELRRLHAVELRPVDVLVAVNDALHEFALLEGDREVTEYELERLMVDQAVSAILAARLTSNARRPPDPR